MAITVADNFSYQGKKPLDGRDTFATLAAMKAYAEASVYDGCLSYCDEDGKRYEFKSTNTVDPTTGKWREYSSGGGGETYSDFTGATASTAGAHGLVPAPSAGDEGKVLFGNGAWGSLPSVDLSNSSVESDILDTTEKAVGTTTDGYLIYQKVVSTGGSVPSGATLLMRVQLLNSTDIIRYTKTTDSPLPSDVKFAGVTSGGEVIYEKHISLTNKSLPNDADVNCGTLSGYSKVSVFADVNSNGIHFNNGRWVGAYVGNNGTIYVSQTFSSQNPTCDIELIVRYTTTS